MENNKIINIHFDGFYYGVHDENIEYTISYIADNNQGIDSLISENINYKELHLDYAKQYVECLNEYFNYGGLYENSDYNFQLKFESMTSPKYYNYSTDRIFCYIPEDVIADIYSKIDKELFAKHIKENFTSYDGFISHYPNRLDQWELTPLDEWDHNELGHLVQCYMRQLRSEYDDSAVIYEDITYNFNEWLWEAIYTHTDSKIIDRAMKVREYLENRSCRKYA